MDKVKVRSQGSSAKINHVNLVVETKVFDKLDPKAHIEWVNNAFQHTEQWKNWLKNYSDSVEINSLILIQDDIYYINLGNLGIPISVYILDDLVKVLKKAAYSSNSVFIIDRAIITKYSKILYLINELPYNLLINTIYTESTSPQPMKVIFGNGAFGQFITKENFEVLTANILNYYDSKH